MIYQEVSDADIFAVWYLATGNWYLAESIDGEGQVKCMKVRWWKVKCIHIKKGPKKLGPIFYKHL